MPPDERLVQLGLMLRQRKRVRVRRTESGESCLGVGIVDFGCLVISQTSCASSPLYVGGSEAFGGQGVGVVPRYDALPSRACRQRGTLLLTAGPLDKLPRAPAPARLHSAPAPFPHPSPHPPKVAKNRLPRDHNGTQSSTSAHSSYPGSNAFKSYAPRPDRTAHS
jgi:hypothetical protein